MRSVQRSPGSFTCESAEISLGSLMIDLLIRHGASLDQRRCDGGMLEGGHVRRTASNQPGRFTASKVWPSLRASQASGKILEIVGDDVPVRLRLEVGGLARTVFERARDEPRRHALSARRRE